MRERTAGRPPAALLFAIIALVGAFAQGARADAPPPEAAGRPPLGKLVLHPEGPGRGRLAFSLGVLWDYPPQRIVEGQISAFPMAELNLRWGLPLGYSAVARVQTALVTNEVMLGASWTHVFDDIPGSPSLAVRALAGPGFGGLVGFGYDAFLFAFLFRPGLAVGWKWRAAEVAFTVRSDVILSTPQTGLFGGYAARTADGRLVGSETALIVENPVHGGGNWYFGAALMIARASYALWLPFAADEAFVAYPRFFAGYGF